MGKSVVQKILETHLIYGDFRPGSEVAIRADQTLSHDATGVIAYFLFETLGIQRVKTKLSASYVDHNTPQAKFESSDDQRYLQSVAAKYGVYFSKPGNGISHQLHLERFSVPGEVLLGLDRHTSTCGGAGMFAIEASALEVALAMAGKPFYLKIPKVLGMKLIGGLSRWVSAKDVILHLLRCLTVEGGVGWILEYFGNGVKSLSVPERATIANMGAELNATTSIFPSDERTSEYLSAQKREGSWQRIEADDDAKYDQVLEVNLSQIEPLISVPHSPDRVREVSQVAGIKVDQVIIGGCMNSSYCDLMGVATILKDRQVHLNVNLVIVPGSRQVLEMLTENGALTDLLRSGARILEPSCGPCLGICQAPRSGGVSLRSFSRNFYGGSGIREAHVYLASPETCAISAVKGEISNPVELGEPACILTPKEFKIDDGMIISPPNSANSDEVEIIRGPNVKPIPADKLNDPLPEDLAAQVLLKAGDGITTIDILPGSTKSASLRSDISARSQYAFSRVDPSFPARALSSKMGVIIGGSDYGYGSNQELVALSLRCLAVKAVIAKSFDESHQNNLANFGIIPLIFENKSSFDWIHQGHVLFISQLHGSLRSKERRLKVRNLSKEVEFWVRHDLSDRLVEILLAGGALNYKGSDLG